MSLSKFFLNIESPLATCLPQIPMRKEFSSKKRAGSPLWCRTWAWLPERLANHFLKHVPRLCQNINKPINHVHLLPSSSTPRLAQKSEPSGWQLYAKLCTSKAALVQNAFKVLLGSRLLCYASLPPASEPSSFGPGVIFLI